MSRSSLRRLIVIGILVFLLAGFAGFQFAIRSLKGQIEQALGPQSEVREIQLSLTNIEIHDIRIRAKESSGWPAEDELRARRIVITPNLFDLLLAKLSVNDILIEGAYIAMLRTRDGQVKIIPSLLDGIQSKASAGSDDGNNNEESPMPSLRIDKILLVDGVVEFFDASIRSTPVKLRLEQISATIGKLKLPELMEQTALNIGGVFKGPRQDGKLSIEGSIELAGKNSDLTTQLRNIDLTVLQPYLIRAQETGVARGTLDLDLKSSVSSGKLHAPGTLTLSNLELSSSSSSFMGLPRTAVVNLLKNRKGKISVKFLLEGNIDDPRFSLNENLVTSLGVSMADTLGINLESLAKEVEKIGGGSTKSIRKSLDKLFRK